MLVAKCENGIVLINNSYSYGNEERGRRLIGQALSSYFTVLRRQLLCCVQLVRRSSGQYLRLRATIYACRLSIIIHT